ncbi:MAG: hypothetical protein ACRDE8_18130 [Ginsengibacter sp.]
MASKFFKKHQQQFEKKGLLLHHKQLIENHYSFLKCKIENNVLVCKGVIIRPDYKNEYKVEVRYVAGKEPYCKIVEPDNILPCVKIHMYKDHSVCLHYPADMKWSGWTPIYQYTIPWLVEWTHYYELYLVNENKWEGPESPVHFTENEKNVKDNILD